MQLNAPYCASSCSVVLKSRRQMPAETQRSIRLRSGSDIRQISERRRPDRANYLYYNTNCKQSVNVVRQRNTPPGDSGEPSENGSRPFRHPDVAEPLARTLADGRLLSHMTDTAGVSQREEES